MSLSYSFFNISFIFTDKLKEFNGKVEPELRLSDEDLANFVQSADLGSKAAGDMIHLDTLLQWPNGKYINKIF